MTLSLITHLFSRFLKSFICKFSSRDWKFAMWSILAWFLCLRVFFLIFRRIEKFYCNKGSIGEMTSLHSGKITDESEPLSEDSLENYDIFQGIFTQMLFMRIFWVIFFLNFAENNENWLAVNRNFGPKMKFWPNIFFVDLDETNRLVVWRANFLKNVLDNRIRP